MDLPIFKNYRLIVNESEVLLDEEDSSVGNLKINCSLQSKHQTNESIVNSNSEDIVVVDKIRVYIDNMIEQLQITFPIVTEKLNNNENSIINHSFNSQIWETTNQIQYSIGKDGFIQSSSILPSFNNNNTAELQMHEILNKLKQSLINLKLSILDVIFVHLYISDMSLFAIINSVYCQYFEKFPPSRSCVAVS